MHRKNFIEERTIRATLSSVFSSFGLTVNKPIALSNLIHEVRNVYHISEYFE